MRRAEVEILLSPEAQKEFEALQQKARPFLRDLALRYLEDLVHFPPEEWVDIHRSLNGDLFKSDNHIFFDIQGKIHYDRNGAVERVLVTRFRAKNPTPNHP